MAETTGSCCNLRPVTTYSLRETAIMHNQNNWQIDGVDNNDFWHNSEAVNQGVFPDLLGYCCRLSTRIDEFNQQSVGGADYGLQPGIHGKMWSSSLGTNPLAWQRILLSSQRCRSRAQSLQSAGCPAASCVTTTSDFSIGGPIIKDQVFFFLSMEGPAVHRGQRHSSDRPFDGLGRGCDNAVK